VESVELDEETRRLRAKVRFGKGALASEVFNDVLDGIRQNISVGYRIDGRVKREGDPDNYYRVATTPMEISIVSIPADQSNLVGVGRSVPATTETHTLRSDPMTEEVKGIDLEAAKAEAVRAARKNDAEILNLAARHNKRDLADQAIAKGMSVDAFRGALLDAITVPADHISTSPFAGTVGIPAKKTLLVLNASSWIGQAHLGAASTAAQEAVRHLHLGMNSPTEGNGRFSPWTTAAGEEGSVKEGGFYVGSQGPPAAEQPHPPSIGSLGASPSVSFLSGPSLVKRGSAIWNPAEGTDMSNGGKLRVVAAYRSVQKIPETLPPGIDKVVQVDLDVPSSIDAGECHRSELPSSRATFVEKLRVGTDCLLFEPSLRGERTFLVPTSSGYPSSRACEARELLASEEPFYPRPRETPHSSLRLAIALLLASLESDLFFHIPSHRHSRLTRCAPFLLLPLPW
jgi:hypothetical protein